MSHNATTPPDFTAQARQLVKACESRTGIDLASDSVPNDLIDRIASFAAEAATAALGRERERIKEALAQVLSQAMMERAIAIIGDDKEQQQ